jgi:hypothetical protein
MQNGLLSFSLLVPTVLLIVAVLPCGGCVGPLQHWGWHSPAAAECGACVECEEEAECGGFCPHCGTHFAIPVPSCHIPCSVCGRVFNCCAPDDAIGPPEIPPPGRFHPVPTHPVFQPSSNVGM